MSRRVVEYTMKRLDDTSKICCVSRLKVALFAAVLYSCLSSAAQQQFSLSGKITDATTGEPLAAANVRIAGTSRGTIANAQGWYSLAVESGERTLIYSYLGYQPETLRTVMTSSMIHHVRLKQSLIHLPEEVVVAEDPAIAIIRKAITNKHNWMDKLKSYRFEAFTRQVLRSDTSVASITEAYTTGYMLAGDTLREIVKQKRQTQNIPIEENFAAVRGVANFNEDDIRLFSFRIGDKSSAYTFLGPTAFEALDYYDYKLLGTTVVAGIEVYRIKMTPKTRLRPLFEGTITIADETFAVMGIDLQPNETFVIPFIKDLALRYRQEFALYDDIFWMPTNVRITGGFSVSFVGLSFPRIGVDLTSTLYDYAVNVDIPDSILKKPRLSQDSSAVTFDSTFWKERDVLPMTEEEETAYRILDSTQTLKKQFQPRGPLAFFSDDGERSFSGLKYIDARFNRVEGFFFGGKLELDSITSITRFSGSAGYGFSDNRFKFFLRAELFTSIKKEFGLGVEVYRKLDIVSDRGYYGSLFNSITSLTDKNDYHDYFLARGWRSYVILSPTPRVQGTLGFGIEQHSGLTNATDYSLFSRSRAFRPNPPANEGTLRSVQLDVRLGRRSVPFDLVLQNILELSLEYSSPSIANSSFDFMRVSGAATWSVPTFSQSMLFPPAFRFKLSGGASGGTLPKQRFFTLDTRSSGYAPFGVLHGGSVKEFEGDRFIMLNIEHNFRTLPFLALAIPFLYRNNIELILHGSIGQTWLRNVKTSSGWYSEAGIGISRILELIRADFTYRFEELRRFSFTVSVANIF